MLDTAGGAFPYFTDSLFILFTEKELVVQGD